MYVARKSWAVSTELRLFKRVICDSIDPCLSGCLTILDFSLISAFGMRFYEISASIESEELQSYP